MKECPNASATFPLLEVLEERLIQEAFSLDVLEEVVREPLCAGDDSEEVYAAISQVAEDHGVPCRGVPMCSKRETADLVRGLARTYAVVDFAADTHGTPTSEYRCMTFWFVHPDIVPVLEKVPCYEYLKTSPRWLLFKAVFYLKGRLSQHEHNVMLGHAVGDSVYAHTYVKWTGTKAAGHGVRQQESPCLIANNVPKETAKAMMTSDVADELGVSMECLRDLTALMDSVKEEWHLDYLGSADDLVFNADGGADDDAYGSSGEDEDWWYKDRVWDAAVIELMRNHIAFPLAKLRHGYSVSDSEHRLMETIYGLEKEHEEIVKDYMQLWEQNQQVRKPR